MSESNWLTTILVIILIAVFFITMPDSDTSTPDKYREELYTLSDGTACAILITSSTNGMPVGVTCNYKEEKYVNHAISLDRRKI